MVSLTLLLLLLLLVAPAHAASGLTAEVYANSVMRGTAVCTHVVPNGWKVESAHELCPAWNGVFMPDREYPPHRYTDSTVPSPVAPLHSHGRPDGNGTALG